MRLLRVVLLLAGAVLLPILVARIGWAPIVDVLTRLAWWQFALICLPYGLVMVVDTLGWRYAFTRSQAPFHRLLGARIAGEALNVVTAVGSVGGEALKAWLLRRDVPYEESVPSVIIAKTTITVAQTLFLLMGIVLAWTTLAVDSEILGAMLWLLVVGVLAVGGFFVAQVMGLVARAGRLLVWAGVATFLVPANLGAFEGANAAAFAALGLGAGAGLAYSLVRRARQVVWVGVGIVLLLVMRAGSGRALGRRARSRRLPA